MRFWCTGPGPEQQCVEGAQDRGPGAQQFGVFPIPLADNKTAYLYVGIRYGSAPDLSKCREFQYWGPLSFNEQGHALPMKFEPEVTLDLAEYM